MALLSVLERTLKRREQRLRAPAMVSLALREESPTLGLSTGGGETAGLEIGWTGKIGRGTGNEIFVSVEHLAQHLMQDRVDLPAEHGRFSSPESLDAGAPDGLSPA